MSRKNRYGLLVGMLVISVWSLLFGAQRQESNSKVILRIEETTNQGIVATPLISPHFDMQTVGEIAPAKGAILDCVVKRGLRAYADHSEPYLLFVCAEPKNPTEFKFVLTGLAFEKESN